MLFRNRTSDEQRDIYVSHRKMGDGLKLDPFEDNWFIGGCPVNGPSAATRGGYCCRLVYHGQWLW